MWKRIFNGADYAGRAKALALEESLLINCSFIGWQALPGTRFNGATLIDVDLRGAILDGLSFSDARLYNCDFTGSVIGKVSWNGCVADASCSWPMGFDPEAAGITIYDSDEEEDEDE